MITVILLLIIIGVGLYLIPMDGTIKTVITIFVVLVALLYMAEFLGLWHGMPSLR